MEKTILYFLFVKLNADLTLIEIPGHTKNYELLYIIIYCTIYYQCAVLCCTTTVLVRTIRDKSRATFEIPKGDLILPYIPFCPTYGFLNCYSFSNYENPLHCNHFKNHRYNRMGFMVIFCHLEGISNVALLSSLIVHISYDKMLNDWDRQAVKKTTHELIQY